MSETRKNGLAFLASKDIDAGLVAVSKKYSAEESWTGSPAWWFDIPIKNIKDNPENYYYLLCDKEDGEFYILNVPNHFLISNLSKFEDGYSNKIRLHLDAISPHFFIDQRGDGKVDFSNYLMDI